MKNSQDKLQRDACLDDMLITRYVLHQCSREERQEVETHLITCPKCRKEVILLTRDQSEFENEDEWGELPEWAFKKGMELVRNAQKAKGEINKPEEAKEPGEVKGPLKIKGTSEIKKPKIEIFLQLFLNHWKVVHHTMTIFPKPVLASRGKTSDRRTMLRSLVKEFGEYRLETDIYENEEGKVDLEISVKKIMNKEPVPQVRFILRNEENQNVLIDCINDRDIPFKGLTPGRYSVEMIHQEKSIGSIALNLQKK